MLLRGGTVLSYEKKRANFLADELLIESVEPRTVL
jgi:hypothetical protein